MYTRYVFEHAGADAKVCLCRAQLKAPHTAQKLLCYEITIAFLWQLRSGEQSTSLTCTRSYLWIYAVKRDCTYGRHTVNYVHLNSHAYFTKCIQYTYPQIAV